jgi:hypothetical protein
MPTLTHCRFDPNPNVQRSMNDIWNALVKDSSATIDKNFDAIMDDLLTSILTKEWRVRQASCAAISDLVQGRNIDKVCPLSLQMRIHLTITVRKILKRHLGQMFQGS